MREKKITKKNKDGRKKEGKYMKNRKLYWTKFSYKFFFLKLVTKLAITQDSS